MNVTVWNSEHPFPWDQGEVRCAQAQEHSITLNNNVVLKVTLVMSRPLVPDIIPRISALGVLQAVPQLQNKAVSPCSTL